MISPYENLTILSSEYENMIKDKLLKKIEYY